MAAATIMLGKNELDLIAFAFSCDTCAVSATSCPSDLADSGVPICGNPECEAEGDDMTMFAASITFSS